MLYQAVSFEHTNGYILPIHLPVLWGYFHLLTEVEIFKIIIRAIIREK